MGHRCPHYCQIRINRELSLTKGNNSLKHGAILTIIKLEETIMVLNNVTKFHRILIKTIQLREQILFKTVLFHK